LFYIQSEIVNNTTGVTTAYPSGAPKFTSGF